MDRISSSSITAHRTEQPQLHELPEDAIRAIISTINKADNQTLSALAQTCKDLWHIASVDTLRSFFYAAREAYEVGDTSKKVAVFCVLADWIVAVADQLPEATRWQILGHLSHMATIEALADPETKKMVAFTNRLIKLAKHEVMTDTERLQASLDLASNKQTRSTGQRGHHGTDVKLAKTVWRLHAIYGVIDCRVKCSVSGYV